MDPKKSFWNVIETNPNILLAHFGQLEEILSIRLCACTKAIWSSLFFSYSSKIHSIECLASMQKHIWISSLFCIHTKNKKLLSHHNNEIRLLRIPNHKYLGRFVAFSSKFSFCSISLISNQNNSLWTDLTTIENSSNYFSIGISQLL